MKIEELKNKVVQGDCLEKLKELEDNSIDAIVTDPPYELGFMGKSWDNTGIANNKEMWAECLRVLKPGGHLLSFGGTRTYHRMAVAIEDAGFEVRDMIEWVYGSGFPKSLNIGKSVNQLETNEWSKIGKAKFGVEGWDTKPKVHLTKGTSDWEGWGTALKPAHEPICMARKPLSEKTVAENCLKYGTGGINIDESRVEGENTRLNGRNEKSDKENGIFTGYGSQEKGEKDYGRFPANLIHDNSEEVRECFPESKTGAMKGIINNTESQQLKKLAPIYREVEASSGNASRFFKSIIYQAKASKSERNKGCEELEEKVGENGNKWTDQDYRRGDESPTTARKNFHPTVKPIALMEYLIKMITPENGVVLDPFAGSGTTGVACQNTNRNYILIEKEQEYIDIINKRLN